MADNVAITAGSGTTVAADDIGSGVLAQRVKPVWGPDGTGTDVDLPTGMPTQAGYKEVSGSASSNNSDLVSVDAAGYRWVMCQITGTWSGTITFQASMDGANWFNILVNRPDSTQNAFGTATANNIYSAALPGRYFRARMTSYTSGTASAIAGFSLHPAPVAAASVRMDTFNSFGTSDNNNWGTAFTVNSTTGVWNGSGFDRARTVGSAKNTTGTGLLAAGMLGFDGTNYQAAKVTTAGDQSVVAGYLEVSGSAAANNTDLTSTDVQLYRWVSVHITAIGSATLTFQVSNDNSNWVSQPLYSVTLAGAGSSTASSTGIYSGSLPARYFRVRTTSWSSGTVSVVVGFSGQPSPPAPLPVYGSGGTFNVGPASTSGTSDGVTSQWTSVNAFAYSFNGTNWDRARSFGTQGALGVTPTPGTTGGWSVFSNTALTNTVVSVKSSAGTLGGYMIYNSNATVAYVQVFNVASGSVTLGTTAPTYVLSIPPGSAANLELTCGVNHSTAISAAATATMTGNGSPGTGLVAAVFYK